jgi:hypothetical protein
MNVEIGTEAAQFPEKKYISGIFFAVWQAIPFRFIFSSVFNFRRTRGDVTFEDEKKKS